LHPIAEHRAAVINIVIIFVVIKSSSPFIFIKKDYTFSEVGLKLIIRRERFLVLAFDFFHKQFFERLFDGLNGNQTSACVSDNRQNFIKRNKSPGKSSKESLSRPLFQIQLTTRNRKIINDRPIINV